MWVEQRERGRTTIGWNDVGDLNRLKTRDRIQRKFVEVYGGRKQRAKQLCTFYEEVHKGDKILASAGQRIYGVGSVSAKWYNFDPNLYYSHSRPVNWELTFWDPLNAGELNLEEEIHRRVFPLYPPTIKKLKERDWRQVERAVQRMKTPYRNLPDFEGIPRAPETEQETIVLFSKLSSRLNMRIEAVGTRFPDALVQVKEYGKWVTKSAEFEFLSSRFEADHERKYRDEGCDLLICWRDDWEGNLWRKPKELHVIELETRLKEFL